MSISGVEQFSLKDSASLAGAAFTDIKGLAGLKSIGREDKSAAIKKVAQEFEAMFIHQLMKSMRETNRLFAEGNDLNSSELEFHQDMFDQQLSLTIAGGSANGKGIGIAEAFVRQLSQQYAVTAPAMNKTVAAPSTDDLQVVAGGSLSDIKSQVPVKSVAEPLAEGQSLKAAPPLPVSPSTELNIERNSNQSQVFNSPKDFIDKLYGFAQEAAKKLGTSAEILLSQAALETGWGKHVMPGGGGKSSHNLFGIKAHRNWSGPTVNQASLEHEQGVLKKVVSDFRSYDSFKESFMDYVDFLKSNPRYSKALLVAKDASAYINELQKAGYATDPNYANKILSIFSRLPAMTTRDKG